MKIGKITAEYLQEPDDYDEANRDLGLQTLTLTAQPCLMHLHEKGKEDYYFVLESNRWAFNDVDEMVKVLRDFKKRLKEVS